MTEPQGIAPVGITSSSNSSPASSYKSSTIIDEYSEDVTKFGQKRILLKVKSSLKKIQDANMC